MDGVTAAHVEPVARQVRDLFRPTTRRAPGRVGAEVELLTFDEEGDRRTTVPVDRMRAILRSATEVHALADVSFEPGGQVELSLRPCGTAATLIASMAEAVRRARTALHRHGIGLAALPLDPWRSEDEIGLQTPADRYVVMQRHFDSVGPLGRRMMRRTASLQVCLDSLPGTAGRRQWLLSNMLGPALAAAFTHAAPGLETRTAVWLGVDETRTGFDGRHIGYGNPAGSYLDFALAAQAMPLPRPGPGPTEDLPFLVPFGEWLSRTGPRPDAEDIRHHLTTLFPPVRPRGYLEIRYLDAQPEEWMAVPVIVLSTLLTDRRAARLALEVTGSDPSVLRGQWERSATLGLTDPGIGATARDLFEIAEHRVSREYAGNDARMLLEAYSSRFLMRSSNGGERGELKEVAS